MNNSKPLSELKKRVSSATLKKSQTISGDILLNMHLIELRELTNLTQTQIAERMGITQPTVANLEKAGKDIRLKSLKKYVEATGCKLRIDIELPDGEHYGFPI